MFDLHIFYLLLIFIAAGLVKGVTGMGLPTVAMGLLGLLMPPQAAAAKVVKLPMKNPILSQGQVHVISRHGRVLPPAATILLRDIVHGVENFAAA